MPNPVRVARTPVLTHCLTLSLVVATSCVLMGNPNRRTECYVRPRIMLHRPPAGRHRDGRRNLHLVVQSHRLGVHLTPQRHHHNTAMLSVPDRRTEFVMLGTDLGLTLSPTPKTAMSTTTTTPRLMLPVMQLQTLEKVTLIALLGVLMIIIS